MQKTVVIDVVGLTPELIGEHTPHLQKFLNGGKMAAINPAIPAVTTTAQSNYLTGVHPAEHGIVANGWYFRDECEIKLWRQSNKLVQHRKIWDEAREINPSFTVANMFWWYNMYSSADYAVTPRPMYPSDGRKLPDIYSWPSNLRFELQQELGAFPLFNFWGPNSSIVSTQWIAKASMRITERFDPTLVLIYLPHLDYGLQRHGPDVSKVAHDLREVDQVIGQLMEFYGKRGHQIVILSEYGITAVDTPIHINRLFRQHNMIAIREELGLELLDAGMSTAFAVADHQIAHIHIQDMRRKDEIKAMVEKLPGVAEVLDEDGKRAYHLDHPRAGDLVALAKPNAWFTYYYWLDDSRAPDFARTVDIHRKPGYDPVELFIDPALKNPKLKAGYKLARKKLGFRYLMDLTPLDATLVKGSHGVKTAPNQGPLFITQHADMLHSDMIDSTDVYGLIMQHLGLKHAETV
ncbi:MAG: alkaline phosphatase family protein [Anaerolineae bacterium]